MLLTALATVQAVVLHAVVPAVRVHLAAHLVANTGELRMCTVDNTH